MRSVESSDFAGLALHPVTVFDEPEFARLNAQRADRVLWLVLGEPQVRLGLIAGVRDGRLRAPFSAPWALPLLGKARPRIGDFQRAAEDLASAPAALGVEGVDLVLPAPHVEPDTVAKWSSALALAGFRPLPPDLSFHLELDRGEERLDPKARQKLVAARRHATGFRAASDDGSCAAAYDVIVANRAARGNPLHLSLDDLTAMRALLPVDFFVLEGEGEPVAAAICYRLSPEIAYLVYWGSVPEPRTPHPMNLLAGELVAHYAAAGCRLLDLGTASIEGTPQQGLADFKQSIGASASLRARFTLP